MQHYEKIFLRLIKDFNLEKRETSIFPGFYARHHKCNGSLMKWYKNGDEFYLATGVKYEETTNTFSTIGCKEIYRTYEELKVKLCEILSDIKKLEVQQKLKTIEKEFTNDTR